LHRLARVRHKGRDLDERRHVRIVTRLSDHRPAIGVADENDRFALRVDDALRRIYVAFERKRGILDDADAVAVLLQLVVKAPPAGAVYEAP
jgi:hypothetical protein